jgi:hypothetical protein
LICLNPFPGQVIDFMVGGVCVAHLAALVAIPFFQRSTIGSVAFLLVISTSAIVTFSCVAVADKVYLKYYAVSDRFRENVASPIPKSVRNLAFVSDKDQRDADLMLEFDISPAELDQVIDSLHLREVPPVGLHCFYKGFRQNGDAVTIKTNESRTHAVFRLDSSSRFRYQSLKSE